MSRQAATWRMGTRHESRSEPRVFVVKSFQGYLKAQKQSGQVTPSHFLPCAHHQKCGTCFVPVPQRVCAEKFPMCAGPFGHARPNPVTLRYFAKPPQPSPSSPPPLARRSGVKCKKPLPHCAEIADKKILMTRQQQPLLSNAGVVGFSCLRTEEATTKVVGPDKSCDVDNGGACTGKHTTDSTCSSVYGSANANSLSLATTPVNANKGSMAACMHISLEGSDGASGVQECQAGPASAKAGPHLKRTNSWSYPNGVDASEPPVCKPMGRSLTPKRLRREKSFNLEASLACCKNELEELQAKSAAESADELRPLFARALDLSWRLMDLSAEALECSCFRDVPGSMEVYEQVNAAVDSAASLLSSLVSRGVEQEELS